MGSGKIERSGARGAWIKLSAGDDGLAECEAKVLRAAVQAAKEAGVVIGSHTNRGLVVREQLRILESLGRDPGRFIWIHTQAEKDFSIHLEIARRGSTRRCFSARTEASLIRPGRGEENRSPTRT